MSFLTTLHAYNFQFFESVFGTALDLTSRVTSRVFGHQHWSSFSQHSGTTEMSYSVRPSSFVNTTA